MPRFDRYMLSQLLTLFGFFSLVLVLIYWINQAVQLFDEIIADGQSAGVFLELTALSLPGIIKVVVPLAAFAASVYVTNRMSAESELAVVQATGFSNFRIARPVLIFGLFIAALMLILNHFLVPLSQARLIERQAEISRNLTARLLTEGRFLSPSSGVTLYIREITQDGELLDVFLSDSRNPDRHIGYTASRAYLVRTDTGPQLVMVDGLAQTLEQETQRLFTTGFQDFAYDVSALIPEVDGRNRTYREVPTPELLRAPPALQQETGRSEAFLQFAGHDRFAQSALALVGALLGYAALRIGGFSRFGLWRQIIGAIGLVVVVKIFESIGGNLARSAVGLWPLTYLPTLAGLSMVTAILAAVSRPGLFRRPNRGVTA